MTSSCARYMVHGINIALKQQLVISFQTLWVGTLLGASLSAALLFFAVICDGIAVFSAVLNGVERLSGGSSGGGAPLVKTMQYFFLQRYCMALTKHSLGTN